MKKILVPTDFSDQANVALGLAHQIARKSNGKIIVLHVLEIPRNTFAPGGTSISVMGEASYGSDLDNVYVVKLHDKTKKMLENLVADPKFKDVDITYKMQFGNPYHGISEEITENEVSLVVMGTKGASGIDEVLIGSNTEKVVRLARCPVLTVKKESELENMKSIVFASNFTEGHDLLMEELKNLQQMLGATIHLVKVNTPNNFETNRQILKEIKGFAEKYGLQNYTVNIYNDLVEEDGIIYFAEDINADIIALATHGRTGFMHLLSGSIAEDVVNHSKRPVWTFTMK
jgi:nucleotide-binding universal stress UspA family protein